MNIHRAHLYRTIGIVCVSISLAILVFTFVAHITMLLQIILTVVGLCILIVGAFFSYYSNRIFFVSIIIAPLIVGFVTFAHITILLKIILYVVALFILIVGAYFNSRRRSTNRR